MVNPDLILQALRLFFQHYYSSEWLRKYIFMKGIELQRLQPRRAENDKFCHLTFLIRLAQIDSEIIPDILPVVLKLLDLINEDNYMYFSEEDIDWLYLYCEFKMRCLSKSKIQSKKLWEDVLQRFRIADEKDLDFITNYSIPVLLEAKTFELTTLGYQSFNQLPPTNQSEILTRWLDTELFQRKMLEKKQFEDDLERYIISIMTPLLKEINNSELSEEDYHIFAWLQFMRSDLKFFPSELTALNLQTLTKTIIRQLVPFVLELKKTEKSLNSLKFRLQSDKELQNVRNVVHFMVDFADLFEINLRNVVNTFSLCDFDLTKSNLKMVFNSINSLGVEFLKAENDLLKTTNDVHSLLDLYAENKSFSNLLFTKLGRYHKKLRSFFMCIFDKYSHSRFELDLFLLRESFNCELNIFPKYFQQLKEFDFLKEYYYHSIDKGSQYSPIYSRLLEMSITILEEFPYEEDLFDIDNYIFYRSLLNPFHHNLYYKLVQKVISGLLDVNKPSELYICIANEFIDLYFLLCDSKNCQFRCRIKQIIVELLSYLQNTVVDEASLLLLIHNLQNLLHIEDNLIFKLFSFRMLLDLADPFGDKPFIIRCINFLHEGESVKAYFTLLRPILSQQPDLQGDLIAIESLVYGTSMTEIDRPLIPGLCELTLPLLEEGLFDVSQLWKYGFMEGYKRKDPYIHLFHCFMATLHNQEYLFQRWNFIISVRRNASCYSFYSSSALEEERFLLVVEKFTILHQKPVADIKLLFKNILDDKNDSFEAKKRKKGIAFYHRAVALFQQKRNVPQDREVLVHQLLDLSILYFKLIESKRPTPKKNKTNTPGPNMNVKLAQSEIEAQINQILSNSPIFTSKLNRPSVP